MFPIPCDFLADALFLKVYTNPLTTLQKNHFPTKKQKIIPKQERE